MGGWGGEIRPGPRRVPWTTSGRGTRGGLFLDVQFQGIGSIGDIVTGLFNLGVEHVVGKNAENCDKETCCRGDERLAHAASDLTSVGRDVAIAQSAEGVHHAEHRAEKAEQGRW